MFKNWHCTTKRKHNIIDMIKGIALLLFFVRSLEFLVVYDRHFCTHRVIVIDSCDLHEFDACRQVYICKMLKAK